MSRKSSKRPIGPPPAQVGRMGSGPAMGKSVNFWPSLRRLIRHLKPERVMLTIVIIFAAISVALSVLGPKILAEATNVIFAGVIGKHLPAGVTKAQIVAQLKAAGKDNQAAMLDKMDLVPGHGIDFNQLTKICLFVLGIYVISNVLGWISGVLVNRLTQRSVYRLRKNLADKLDRLPLSYFDKLPRGELLSRVTNDIDNVAQNLQQTLNQVFSSLLTIVAVLVMMFTISPTLMLVAVVTVIISAGVAGAIGKRSQKQFAAMWKATGNLSGQVEETATGHTLVRVFGRSATTRDEFEENNAKWRKSAFTAQFLSGMMMPVMFFISNLNFVAVAVIGGLKVTTGQLNIGDVQAFIQYSRQFSQPVTQLASMANLLQSGVASAERVFEVLDEAEETPDATGTFTSLSAPTNGVGLEVAATNVTATSTTSSNVKPSITGEVRFENVAFSYVPNKPLIENLNLTAKPGDTIAIVGPTGAGKTTLVNLLMRFYDVNAGRITIDSTDIRDVPRDVLRNEIGMVLQDTWLFGGTIAENIGYGKTDATREEIIAAAKASYVDHVIRAMPHGYDTVLGDDADNISVGERQLLTIARAFLANRSILVLDEATSSVDTRTEVLVQKAMNRLRENKTSFVIAHRLSTIRDANVIVVMENGHIVEQGSHTELLQAKGAYYRLYRSQFEGLET